MACPPQSAWVGHGLIRRQWRKSRRSPRSWPGLRSILDLGCGSAARLLHRLAGLGFTDLTGADPFIAEDVIFCAAVSPAQMRDRRWPGLTRLSCCSHSFEHMPDPRSAIGGIARLLAPGGSCILRVPTPDCEAFERYRADWVQIDAPRHLNLPSRKGVAILARQAGLVLTRTIRQFHRIRSSGEANFCARILPSTRQPARSMARPQLRDWRIGDNKGHECAGARAIRRRSF